MNVAYACQDYLGGLDHYRAAKDQTVRILAVLIDSMPAAILTMEKYEQDMISKGFGSMSMPLFSDIDAPRSDRLLVCLDILNERSDEISQLISRRGLQ